MDVTKALEALVKYVSHPVESDLRAKLQGAQGRLRNWGKLESADYDEAFLRVAKAAHALNEGDAFLALNKFLSKFAHPTAMTVFSTFDTSDREGLIEFFFAAGAGFFSTSITNVESFIASQQ